MVKKLHELIEMSCNGKKFEAKTNEGLWMNHEEFLATNIWSSGSVLADWTVRMKRGPRVIWINEATDGDLEAVHNVTEDLAKLNREVGCKTIKFIEVIENE